VGGAATAMTSTSMAVAIPTVSSRRSIKPLDKATPTISRGDTTGATTIATEWNAADRRGMVIWNVLGGR
jgi:hypothetical protein